MDLDLMNFEFVEDDFTNAQHKEMDEQISAIFGYVNGTIAPHILAVIVDQSGDRLLREYANLSLCKNLLTSEQRILDMILEGSKVGYRKLRLLKLFRQAPVKSWDRPYVGNAAIALWEHIQRCFYVKPGEYRRLCAKYCAVVQASGMGKSRAVDEMSKTHFVIPVNLREPGSFGFPPPDTPAHFYLDASCSQAAALIRSCSFLHALFHWTTDAVKQMDKGNIAHQFRENMNCGMTYLAHNEYRKAFYGNVAKDATKTHFATYSAYFLERDRPTDAMLLSHGFPLRLVFQELCRVLKEWSQQSSKLGNDYTSPQVVLAFDEVYSLSKLQKGDRDQKWSQFGELRRVIRVLATEPLFTLFLSTFGTMFSITPTPSCDRSARMTDTSYVSHPFFELGFDQLALRVDFSQMVTLSQITAEERLASYGRPLWLCYGGGSDLIKFAAKKLLGGTGYTRQPINVDQQLACLAQRIPIEFLSARYVAQVSEQEKEQVHSHMRVILNAENDLETMVTTSPSEPILSEAAYFVMTTQPPSHFSPPQALRNIINEFVVYKGELGELMMALLFTMARDEAVGPADEQGRPKLQGQRWCRVTDLLQSLFCSATIVESHGCKFRQSGTDPCPVPLSETFKNSKAYFTHFIKVHEHAVVDLHFLMRLMVRGAAVLCGNGQHGIDGIIPFLFKDDEIRLDNIGVIMFQVINSAEYTDDPKPKVLLEMDSLHLGLTDASVPVIRFVFALSAATPTVSSVIHSTTHTSLGQFTAYDFWVSGLSCTILRPVVDKQAVWESILQVSHGWHKIYSGRNKQILGKSMNPGVAMDKEYWQNWCESVPEVVVS